MNWESDCSGILDMLAKPLSKVTNKRLQKIMESVGHYNFINQHVPGTQNKVCNALSRLCKSLSGYSRYYRSKPPRLLKLLKNQARRVKEIDMLNPLLQESAKEAYLDEEYLNMLHSIENKVKNNDLPLES